MIDCASETGDGFLNLDDTHNRQILKLLAIHLMTMIHKPHVIDHKVVLWASDEFITLVEMLNRESAINSRVGAHDVFRDINDSSLSNVSASSKRHIRQVLIVILIDLILGEATSPYFLHRRGGAQARNGRRRPCSSH